MPQYLVSSKASIAAEVYGRIKDVLGPVMASRWMFTGHDLLDGMSPLQAIKLGRAEEVRKMVDAISVAGVVA